MWKFWVEFILYNKWDKGEAMVDDVRVVEEVAADYGTRGRYDPPKLWFPCSSFVFFVVVSVHGGQRSTRAQGTLSEAKTQRRPHSERERVSFVVSLFLYISLSRARKDT